MFASIATVRPSTSLACFTISTPWPGVSSMTAGTLVRHRQHELHGVIGLDEDLRGCQHAREHLAVLQRRARPADRCRARRARARRRRASAARAARSCPARGRRAAPTRPCSRSCGTRSMPTSRARASRRAAACAGRFAVDLDGRAASAASRAGRSRRARAGEARSCHCRRRAARRRLRPARSRRVARRPDTRGRSRDRGRRGRCQRRCPTDAAFELDRRAGRGGRDQDVRQLASTEQPRPRDEPDQHAHREDRDDEQPDQRGRWRGDREVIALAALDDVRGTGRQLPRGPAGEPARPRRSSR